MVELGVGLARFSDGKIPIAVLIIMVIFFFPERCLFLFVQSPSASLNSAA